MPAERDHAASMLTIKKILVPTDFSPATDEAVGAAIDLAKLTGASIDLCHVFASLTMLVPPPMEMVSFMPAATEVMSRIDESLGRLRARVEAAGITVTTATLSGTPATEILRQVGESGADLIVMGTHGRGGLAHAVLG